MKNPNILISQGHRPLWHTLIAALCFTISLVVIFGLISGIYNAFVNDIPFRDSRHYATALGLCLVFAVRFSMVQNHHFDLENKKHKIIKKFGLVEFGKWKPLENLEYVSMFKKKENVYIMSLWFDKNKHYKLSSFKTKDEVLFHSKNVARKLELNLFDSTNPQNSNWISLS